MARPCLADWERCGSTGPCVRGSRKSPPPGTAGAPQPAPGSGSRWEWRRAAKDRRGSRRRRNISRLPPRRRSDSLRRLRTDGQAAHASALALVVVHRVVLRAAVVPHRERAGLPAHAAAELRADLVRLQELNERPAFVLAHVAKANGMAARNIQRFATG